MVPHPLAPGPQLPVPNPQPARGALRLIHPFPTALNAVAVALLAVVAVRGWPGFGVVGRLALTMLAAQAAIGAVNDIVDRRLDAVTKPWKPIPSGGVSLRGARWVAGVAIMAALALGVTFGPAAWALSTAGMAIGLAYDLWLKRSAWSGLTYAVALPLVPLWVWTALDRFTPALLWVWPIGLVLGAALQIANALPDLEDDAAQGIRGTAQRLGLRRALAVAWGGYLIAVLAAVALGLALGHDRRPLLAGAGLALSVLLASIGVYIRRPGSPALQLGWTLLAPGAGVLAVTWLTAVQ